MFALFLVTVFVVGGVWVGHRATRSETVAWSIRGFSLVFTVTFTLGAWAISDPALRNHTTSAWTVATELVASGTVAAGLLGAFFLSPLADGLRRRRAGELLAWRDMLVRATQPFAIVLLTVVAAGILPESIARAFAPISEYVAVVAGVAGVVAVFCVAGVASTHFDRGFGFSAATRWTRVAECVATSSFGLMGTFCIQP